MIKIYSYKRDGNVKLSPHFSLSEFKDRGRDNVPIDTELIDSLERLYAHLKCSKMIITSGYRGNNSGDFHTKGMAADVNCYVGGRRIQGKPILLAAQEVGFRGIGWIPGSIFSRAAVHLDTRPSRYFFDEAKGNRSIGDSWYTFFGMADPGKPQKSPDVLYQVYAGRRWLPIVTNYGEGDNGYAGIPNVPIQGVRAKLSRGNIEYRVYVGGRWLPWVKDFRDYAGLYGRNIGGIQMRLVGLDGYAAEYRTAVSGSGYGAWVREDMASFLCGAIDRLQCRIVKV